MKSYEQFLADLAVRESSGRYDVENQYGYLGKYQIGKLALIDSGYYRQDGKNNNEFLDKFWTGKDGVKSKADFLTMPEAQENAIREYMKVQWRYCIHDNLDRFLGQSKHGCEITISGLLAGAHLCGEPELNKFFKRDHYIPTDGNKVSIMTYIQKFAGYDTPFSPRKKLTGIQKNKQRQTIAYQIDRQAWVSVSEAIAMVKNSEVDGVVVTRKCGTIFLKTPPDQTKANNLGEVASI